MIRTSELITATVVALGVVVFGSVEEARADYSISEVCATLDLYEQSGWFCEENAECRSATYCIRVITDPHQDEGYEQKMRFWKTRQIRIMKLPPTGTPCSVISSRCPAFGTSRDCGGAAGYYEVLGPC